MYGAVQKNQPIRFGQFAQIKTLDELVDSIKETQIFSGDSCRAFVFTLGDGLLVKKLIGFDAYANVFDVTHSNGVMEYLTDHELLESNVGFSMQNSGIFTEPL